MAYLTYSGTIDPPALAIASDGTAFPAHRALWQLVPATGEAEVYLLSIERDLQEARPVEVRRDDDSRTGWWIDWPVDARPPASVTIAMVKLLRAEVPHA